MTTTIPDSLEVQTDNQMRPYYIIGSLSFAASIYILRQTLNVYKQRPCHAGPDYSGQLTQWTRS
jgi:hypothetical protein